MPPLMSREEAASYIGNAVAAFKIERQNFLGKIVAATEFPGDRISCDTGAPEGPGRKCSSRLAHPGPHWRPRMEQGIKTDDGYI